MEKRAAREYAFIGNAELFRLVHEQYKGACIRSQQDIVDWIKSTGQKPDWQGWIAATFVIDTSGTLLLADRHSEHVQCANGKNVLSAGEIFFELLPKNNIRVKSITNQSIGYCPSYHSWEHIEKALSQLGIEHPGGFEPVFEFSYCRECKSIKVIKEDFLFCHRCGEAIPGGEEFQWMREVLF